MEIAKQLVNNQENGLYVKQLSDEWHAIRKTIITATDVSTITGNNIFQTERELFIKKISECKIDNDAVKWGNTFEPIAKSYYEFKNKEKCYELGLVIHNKYPFLGASPDGILMSGKLIEIKCPITRQVDGTIPIQYWIQMQIQMEVCDMPVCDYIDCQFYKCVNKDEYDTIITDTKGTSDNIYWVMKKCIIKQVDRDTEWFKKTLHKISTFHNYLSNYNGDIPYQLRDWHTWIAASHTKNFMIDDPLIDWLEKNSTREYSGGSVNLFTNKLFELGKQFEKKIVESIKLKCKDFVQISNGCDARSIDQYKKTLWHIDNQTPIIYQGVLHDTERRIYGIPDLLVYGKWLKLFGLPESNGYRVIEIKNSKIYMAADKKHIRNSNKRMLAYKSQLFIYNSIIGKAQGYTPSRAYILGNSSNIPTLGYHVGCVNYNVYDRNIRGKTKQAISWLRNMRKNGHQWTTNPPSVPELMPNMCNDDAKWNKTKKSIADETNDITALWMCGTKNRKIGLSNNITNWRRQRTTSKQLGVNGDKVANTLQLIIDYNQDPEYVEPFTTIDKLSEKYMFYPHKIKNTMYNWRRKKLEFYVDFETVNDMSDNWDGTIIFMIGVYYYDQKNKTEVFKNFCVDLITETEERKIIQQFNQYVHQIMKRHKVKKTNVYHWGNIERLLYTKACCKYNIKEQIKWCNLLSLFRDEPIVVRGSMNFGLKNIAKAMYANTMIPEIWEESYINDGLNAMIYAYQEHINCVQNNTTMNMSSVVGEIVKYNRIDCKVMYDIVNYLRKKH